MTDETLFNFDDLDGAGEVPDGSRQYTVKVPTLIAKKLDALRENHPFHPAPSRMILAALTKWFAHPEMEDFLAMRCPNGFGTVDEQYPDHDDAGYVYLMRAGDCRYKLGKSADPKTRLNQLGHASPIPIKFVKAIAVPNMTTAEKCLHTMFAAKRDRGEWFLLDRADVARFKALSASDLCPETK